MSAAAAVSGPEREVGSMNKLRETAAFLRYAINPRKAKAAVLAGQCVTLMMLIGCRAQMARDTNRFEADLEALRAAHATEMQQITKQAEDGIYATQYLSSRYEGEAWTLGQWLDCLDARYALSTEAKEKACWAPINRMQSDEYPDDLESVLWQEGQFCEFSDAVPPTEENFAIATNQLSRYYNGDIRPVPATAVYITVSDEGVVLRDTWEETAKTQHWRA